MKISETSVHGSHCCPEHGCKYGDDDCLVVSGLITPAYPGNNGCELCEFNAERGAETRKQIVEQLERLIADASVEAGSVWGAYDRGYYNGLRDAINKVNEGSPAEEPFKCSAKIWTGPGHQSSHRCSRREPHPLSSEHYVEEVVYDWTGEKAFADYWG